MNRQWSHHRSWYEAYGEGTFPCGWCEKPITLIWSPRPGNFRLTRTSFVIHHLDDDHNNNDAENLEVMHSNCHIACHRTGIRVSDETRRRLSESHKGQVSPMKGKPGTRLGAKWSDEQRAKFEATIKARNRSV